MAYIQKSYQKKFGNKDNSMETNIIEDVTYLVEKANNTPDPTYKVYTALLTQSGESIVNYLYSGSLVKGVSYTVTSATSNCDFTNVGGPSGVSGAGLSFVATENLEPNNWDGSELEYNEGAPVATVLENTLGNVWITYEGAGTYFVYSNGLFAINKTWGIADAVFDGSNGVYTPVFVNVSNQTGANLPNSLEIKVQGGDFNGNGLLNNTPIEIRVYN